jgi:hypothetical protein
VGHPLLVKVSYHPRWKAEGADGPYLVSPALMMIVPRQATVRLTYARTMADQLGWLLTGATLVAGTAASARGWRRRGQPKARPENVPPIPLDDCADMPAPTRRWGAAIPAAFLVACLGARLATLRPASVDPMPLYESASRAYGAGRFADAAEYARHACPRERRRPCGRSCLCLRGESLLRAGQARWPRSRSRTCSAQPEPNPYVAQALFGVCRPAPRTATWSTPRRPRPAPARLRGVSLGGGSGGTCRASRWGTFLWSGGPFGVRPVRYR